jgi:8-amino-7-oxononanoate synthase
VAVFDFLETQIQALKARGLYRNPDHGSDRQQVTKNAQAQGVDFIDASSNNYLNRSDHFPDVSRETPFSGLSGQVAPLGAGASRLIHGTRPEHSQLEADLAHWVGQERALLFSSGYAANVGAISALVQPDDLIISDELNHASIIDGCRLSRAQIRITAHLDSADIESALLDNTKRRCWVVTESYFSMDGDSPDLQAIRSLCNDHGALLIVDEAHALGVFGPQGSGLCPANQVNADVLIGTFGKALGAQGAFVASSRVATNWLWNRARSFVYSTAMSPALAASIAANVRATKADDNARARLESMASWLRFKLGTNQIPITAHSHGPIIPILYPDSNRALKAAASLAHLGILAQAIRPPTVPENASRIRLTLHAGLSQSQLERLAESIIQTCKL